MIPDTITSNPAILASVIARADLPELAAGSAAWHPLLKVSLTLLAMTDANHIRIAVDTHTLIIQRERDSIVGVVIVTGDPIGKSIHRMIRRAVGPAKRGAKPRKAAEPSPAVPADREESAPAHAAPATHQALLRAAAERRIVENEGRDDDGDIVIRDGKPHPAHIPSQW